jgi:hypothetical protein
MTSLPQTHQRTFPAQDSRCRTSPVVPSTPDAHGTDRGHARPALPAVDPSTAFGCVDWFLYPDEAANLSAAEVQAKRVQA